MKAMKRFSTAVAIVCIGFGAVWAEDVLTSMKIFDKSGNNLLNLEYEYAGGKVSQIVMRNALGYLFRTVKYEYDEENDILRKTFVGPNGIPTHVTESATDAGTGAIGTDVFDHFAKPKKTHSWRGTSVNNWQGVAFENTDGEETHRITYTKNGDRITRASVAGPDGTETHYALMGYNNEAPAKNALPKQRVHGLTIYPTEAGLYVRFGTENAGRVRAQVYTLSGRSLGTVLDKKVTAGRHGFSVPLNTGEYNSAGGAYILRFETEGSQIAQPFTLVR
jgi:hypothetical protein